MSEPDPHRVMEELVQLHARQLGEHVDSVQIFVTKQTEGGETTGAYHFGTGNFFARLGQVRDFLMTQDEYTRETARISQRKDLEE